MLDIRAIRSNPEEVKRKLTRRGQEFRIDEVLKLDEQRRQVIYEVEELKSRKNKVSEEVAKLKRAKQDAEAVVLEMRQVSEKIKEMDERVRNLDEEITGILLTIPNTPYDGIPDGSSDADNVEIRKQGEPTKFEYEPKAHWDIGVDLNILDFETAGKVTGARFTFYRGLGAKLERALINFMLDTHTENGYTEIFPPFMVHRRSMTGTGQLPKFEEDAFKVQNTEYFLVPTAEVPVTNMYREQILDGSMLPIRHTAYTACFRAEAGSAGRDTRGLIRQHQFNKVELVKFTNPENSYEELEKLTEDAERILKLLKLPYRVVCLCAGDLGFSSAKTYDLEVWMPSYGRYVEISSCSNFEDFQARRADIKFRPEPKEKPRFVHTLNGSGLAVGRTVAAILENFQQGDGSVIIPEVLRPYMGGLDKITKA
ncbi:MAG TPA: serine--tRNA ligase [Bacillota bacterium]|nr:serine--tRNA ligase [Bacillota bacterium]HPA53716.1 serine--tRNA ligase [Bacillota bacterium]HPX69085.1 serine--tRNA ligase [Bacillota bacterium]HQA65244.1 serine--tRNA ligase [Bacillota bacterium]HQO41960.1 serine--tRNA ligase [Bacillota bacterium]